MEEDKTSRVSGEKNKLERINNLQQKINEIKLTPWTFNEDKGDWNYKLWIELVGCMLDEVWSQLNKDERKEGRSKRESVDELIKRLPPFKISYGSNIKKKYIFSDNENQTILKREIIKYDNLVRDYIEKYYASSFSEEGGDESGLSYD